jgi:hypothetical protein
MGIIECKSEKKPVADILDRVFDKGIVIDGRTRLFLMDTKLQAPGTRVRVAPLDTPTTVLRGQRGSEIQRKRRAA